jgi:hypothetical protein
MTFKDTGFTDPRGMKLCPIHRTSLFLSDGWEFNELSDETPNDLYPAFTPQNRRFTRIFPPNSC